MLYAGQHIGKYVVRGTLGSGGMAIVYRAWDEYMRREVALKFLPEEEADGDFDERFVREARLLAQVEHDNVVCIFDVIPVPGGRCYAMEYVEGPTVESLLVAARRDGQTGLGVDRSLVILRGVARALAAAHGKGVLHRDVKPANVILDEKRDRPVLVDFGLARGGGQKTLTQEGTVLGTLFYLSPEQVRGERMTCAGDVYQWGVMAWHLLAGHLPFEDDDDLTAAMRRISEGLPSLASVCPDLPPELVTIVGRATEIHPSARYADGAALTEALEAFMVRTGRLQASQVAGRGLPRPAPLPSAPPPPLAPTQAMAGGGGPALRGLPTVAMDAGGPKRPSRVDPRRLLWSTPLIVVLVLALQHTSLLGTAWPPRSLDVRSSPRSIHVALVTGRPLLADLLFRISPVAPAEPSAVGRTGSVAPADCLVEPGRYEFDIADLAPGTRYLLELHAADSSAQAAVGVTFATKPLPLSRLGLRGTGEGAELWAVAERPCELALQGRRRYMVAWETRASSGQGLDHRLPWSGYPERDELQLLHTDAEGATAVPLDVPELVDRGLDELRSLAREGLPASCLRGEARLPSPESLAEGLDGLLRGRSQGEAERVAHVVGLLDAWLDRALPVLRRDGLLVRLFLEAERFSVERRAALAAACAALGAGDWYRARRKLPGEPRGTVGAMPASLRPVAVVPEGFRQIGNKRFPVDRVVYQPGDRPAALVRGEDAKEWAVAFTVGKEELLPPGAVAALALDVDDVTQGFLPVVEVSGIPLYMLLRVEPVKVLVCTFPPGILREGKGNGLRIRLVPAGYGSERVQATAVRFLADRDPNPWGR